MAAASVPVTRLRRHSAPAVFQSATPAAVNDRKSRAGPATLLLLTKLMPPDGGTPLPVANMPANAAGASVVTAPAAVVAA
ncbi:hypothetical protein D3C71_1542620 [compost metagenome]